MYKKYVFSLLILTLTTSCATARGRFLLGAGTGALVAGGTGALLSPNAESRGLNALVFCLAGALLGGAASAFLIKDPEPHSGTDPSLKVHELGNLGTNNSNFYLAPTNPQLPTYVKERLQPVIIEESQEPDTVGDDGTLHAPHKIYRIQRPAELYAKPTNPSPQAPTDLPAKEKSR